MLNDPFFWLLVVGFALILVGVSPLVAKTAPGLGDIDRGCGFVIVGIVVVVATTAAKLVMA